MRPTLEELSALLRCPVSGQPLAVDAGSLVTADGERRFPVVRGVPILLAEDRSLFSIADYLDPEDAYGGPPVFEERPPRTLRGVLGRLVPDISRDVGVDDRVLRLTAELRRRGNAAGRRARLLVVGGQLAGAGSKALVDADDIDVVESDLALGPRTQLVCDAHDLPFADGAFDGVLCQAVLEHVLDPYRCSDEIRRVLAPGGVVCSEIPFMQQVHGGALDFTRFTHLGHRRLWRHFDEIASGANNGPGMALAWSAQHFLMAFPRRFWMRAAAFAVARWSLFWLKYLDSRLVDTPGGLDAAAGTFFLGTKRDEPLPDRAIVQGYRGAL